MPKLCRAVRILDPRGIDGAAAFVLIVVMVAQGGDWPQFRGPNQDGTSTDQIFARWATDRPRQLWKVPLKGYGSFAVSQGVAYALSRRFVAREDEETCLALNADSGLVLWETRVGTTSMAAWNAPNSTPTVSDGRVFVLSTDQTLSCLDAQTGRVIWTRDFVKEFESEEIAYGSGGSPIADEQFVYVNSNARDGNRLMAFRKTNGETVWKTAADQPDHSTPVIATIAGRRQVIFSTRSELVAVTPDRGEVLWRFTARLFGAEASPVVVGDIVLVPNKVFRAVRIEKTGEQFNAAEIWGQIGAGMGFPLATAFSTPVCQDGYIYVLCQERLICAELTTGKIKWRQTGFGEGGIVFVGGILVILNHSGEVVLAAPNPTAYTELAHFQALPLLSSACYNHPAMADGRLYARSTTEGVCLNLADNTWTPSPLKLNPPQRLADGRTRLLIGLADGSDLSSERSAGIQIFAARNLQLPLSNWTKLGYAASLTNGVLLMDVPRSLQDFQRFFYAVEKP